MSHKISTTSQNHNNNSSGFFNRQNAITNSSSGLFNQLNLELRRLFKLPLDFYSCMVSSGKLSLRRSRTLSGGSLFRKHIRSTKLIRTSAIVATFALILVTSAIMAPIYNNISITEAATGTAATSSLTMNVTNATASVDLSVLKDNGTFASSTNPIALNITTNNYSGYTLSLSGTSSNLTNDVRNGNSTESNPTYATLSSIASAIDTDTFKADNATAGNNYNGRFGLQPSKYNSESNSNYLPAPTASITLDQTDSANSGANSYTIGLGARASYETTAGTYTGTYKLTAVGNPINYIINYDKNTTDTVTNLPNKDDSSTSETTISLNSQTPERDGYTFEGWCSTTTSDDSCTGTTYKAGGIYGIDQTTANNATLYAMWSTNAVDMQNLAISSCVTSQATKVKDTRDGTIYEVQRLADGKCWLLDNLALGAVALKEVLSTDNTNMSSSTPFSLPSSGSINSYTTAQINTASYVKTGSGGYTSGKYGVYYNYCAATAGTYCMAEGSGSGNASYDICPKGWRMPTGGSSGEYQALYSKYNNYSGFVNALRTPLSGDYGNSSAANQGSGGLFWSSTRSDGNYIYRLYLDMSNVYPMNNNGDRAYGRSVRCVLEERTIADVTYMQDVTATMVSNTAENARATLTDKRDNQTYTVAKIGNLLWMTRNLAIGCNGSGSKYDSSVSSKTLTSLDSDVSSTWSTPTALLSAASPSTDVADYTNPRMQCNTNYGAWYNYAAATAGTITSDNNNINASYSICPSSWRLPTHIEFSTMSDSLAANTSAFDPVYSGYYNDGKLRGAGSVGRWWASTAIGFTNRYFLYYYNNGEISPNFSDSRYNGDSIRCVHTAS